MKNLFRIFPATLLALCASHGVFGQTLLQESFDASSFPTSWNVSGNGARWERTPHGNGSGKQAHSGAGKVEFDNGGGLLSGLLSLLLPTNTAVMVSPAVDFSQFSGGNNVVNVWIYRTSKKSSNPDKVEFFMNNSASLNGASSLGTVYRNKNYAPAVDGTGWYRYSFEVPASFNSSTSAYLLIKGTHANGEQILLDDISISHCASSVSAVVSNVSCTGADNGEINLTVNNGTAPYEFEWSYDSAPFAWNEDINGLGIGSYAVQLIDAVGCRASGNYSITQPSPLYFTANVSNVSCNAVTGDIITTPTGGTPPYSYSWSGPNGFSATTKDISAAPGFYSLTLTDANGCESIGSYTIGEAIGVSGLLTHNTCFGGNIGNVELVINGGTPPYSYNWNNAGSTNSNSIGNLQAGTYTVTVTDPNNCVGTGSFIINQPTVISIVDTIKHVSCFGGNNASINVGVSGGTPPYSYSWSNAATTKNITNLSQGTYTLTITDANNCAMTATYTIEEPTLLTASNVKTDILCYGGNNGTIDVTVSGGTQPYSYNWVNSYNNSQDRNNLYAGTYSLNITDAQGCTSSTTAILSQPTMLTIANVKTNVSCNGGTNGAIDITVSGGTAPYTYQWSNTETTEDITGLVAGTYTVTVTDANNCTKTAAFNVSQPSILSLSKYITNVSCFGGSNGKINLSVTGGVSPYNYVWSNNYTGQDPESLTAGTYTVTVTDASGCTKQGSYTVTEPPLLTVTGTPTNIHCYGSNSGAITLTVSGGTPNNDEDESPYEYTWNSGSHSKNRSNLTAGTYSVTVEDDKGCTATANFTLTQPDPIVISPTTVNLACNGISTGSIDVAVSGGVGPYTYMWNNNGGTSATRTGLAAGTYGVTVKDNNNCTKTASYTLTQPSALSLTKTVSNVSCNGGSDGNIDLSVAGGVAPYSINWSNNANTEDINNLPTGTYSVNVTDVNGCQKSTTVIVSEPAILAATGTHTNATCNGGTNGSIDLIVSGGTMPYNYNWGTGAPSTQDRSNLAAGNYIVTVTDAKGCVATASFTITEPSAITTAPYVLDVQCHGASTGSIDLALAGGVAPYSIIWNTNETSTSISGKPAGTYTATVTDANNCIYNTTATIAQPAPLVVGSSITNATCAGSATGAIDISVTGGVGTYTYLWNNSATSEDLTGLNAGSYSITVTDGNNCSQSASYTVAGVSGISLTAVVNNVSCNGGSDGNVDIAVTGGTAPYTYNWSNSAATQDISGLSAGAYSVTVTDANGCSTPAASYIVAEPAMLAISGVTTDETCGLNNGTISLNIAGGASPYNCVWNNNCPTPSQSGLSAGTYSVIATDANGCNANASFTVATAPAMNVAATLTQPTCNTNNGSINLSVTGGSGIKNYLWNDASTSKDRNNLGAGTYSVTVTDATNCTATASFTLTAPTLNIDEIVTNVSCNGDNNGKIVLSGSGGIAPYTYNWANSYSTASTRYNLSPGTYTVTMTDANNCTKTKSIVVTEPSDLNVSANNTDVTCHGAEDGAINMNVTGGTAPYTYYWWFSSLTGSSQNNLEQGLYIVSVIDANSCAKTKLYYIDEPSEINITTSKNNTSCNSCNNGSINASVSGGTPPYSYSWSNNATTQDISGIGAGSYTLTVTDAKGCTKSKTTTVNVTAAPPLSGSISVSPVYTVNPGGAPFTIYDGYGPQSVTLTASASGGVPPYTYTWSGSNITSASRSVSPSNTTVYTVTIKDANNATVTKMQQIKVVDVSSGKKVKVCHNGNNTLSISANAVAAHLAHGDMLGECNNGGGGWCKEVEDEHQQVGPHEETAIKVFPNPSAGVFTVEVPFEGTNVEIMITDLHGKMVDRRSLKENWEPRHKFDFTSLAKGVYMIQVKTDKQMFKEKVVIR